MRRWVAGVVVFCCALTFDACAGGGPQNVAVVVNANSWASLAVANEFIRLRHIPAKNVIYLDTVPSIEHISVEDFRKIILAPVLKTIADRKLTEQIDCVAYSADFPTGVNTSVDSSEVKFPYYNTRVASLTGMTYLHEKVEGKDTAAYLSLNVNRYMRWVNVPNDKAFSPGELKQYVECLHLMDENASPEWVRKYSHPLSNILFWLRLRRALPLLEKLARDHPTNNEALYNLACCQSRLWKFDEAMVSLKASVNAGWADAYHTAEDDDLAGLRKRPDFKDMLEAMAKVSFETKPELSFRAADAWNEKCEIAADGNGEHYLLSTMLAVTSGRGTSVLEAINALNRSLQADGTHPTGSIYYMLNGDVRSTTRRWAFHSAVNQLEALGVKAEIIPGILPPKKSDVMGAMVGSADFDWEKSGSTILPGAICEHLTSLGGVMLQYGGQTPCTTFIRNGAAGSSGAVEEPFALQQKFPTPFIHVFYARGCTLAESYYQAVSGPYQLLVIGDPLCAPWMNPPTVLLEGVKPNDAVSGTLTLHPAADAKIPVGSFELFVDGQRIATAKPQGELKLDSTTLSDGFHELMLVGIAADRIACQGRVIVPVTVKNHCGVLVLTSSETRVTWEKKLHFSAKMKGAKSIRIGANGRTLGTISGEDGAVDVDAGRLGLGSLSVQAYGLSDETIVAAVSAPLTVNVDPVWIAAVDADKAATYNGMRVTLEDGSAKVAETSRDEKWLSKAGATRERACSIDAWFTAPSDEIYQFQFRSPRTVTIEADGVEQRKSAVAGWQFVPLPLRKGAHHFKLTVAPGETEPRLDLRFGASGTHSIEAGQFKCVDAAK